jgi:hypothetical protein
MAMSEAAKEAIWFQQLFRDLRIADETITTKIYADNQGSMALAKNPEFHPRTKHIEIRYHFIREKLEEKLIHLDYCGTEEMIADLLTKGLIQEKHTKHALQMGIRFGNDDSRDDR